MICMYVCVLSPCSLLFSFPSSPVLLPLSVLLFFFSGTRMPLKCSRRLHHCTRWPRTGERFFTHLHASCYILYICYAFCALLNVASELFCEFVFFSGKRLVPL